VAICCHELSQSTQLQPSANSYATAETMRDWMFLEGYISNRKPAAQNWLSLSPAYGADGKFRQMLNRAQLENAERSHATGVLTQMEMGVCLQKTDASNP